MGRRLEIIKNVIAEVVNYLILFAAGVVVWGDFMDTGPDFGLFLAVGMVPLFYYAARERCEGFWLFMLLHLLPWVGFWLLYRGLFERILLFFLLAVITLMSLGRKLKGLSAGMDAAHPAFGALVFWALYLIDGRFGGGSLSGFLLYVGTGFAVGYLLRYFFRQFIRYIDVNNRTTENIPTDHVFRSAVLLAGGFTAAVGGLMIFGTDKRLADFIGTAIVRGLVSLIRFLLSLLGGEAAEEEPVIEAAGGAGGEELAGLMEQGEPSLLAKILEALLEIFVAAALIALAVAGVVALIRLIREIFSRRSQKNGEEGGAFEDQVEKLEREKRKQRGPAGDSLWERMGKALSPEERIRRIYRKTLEREFTARKEEDLGLPGGATPRECCNLLFPEAGEAAAEFAGLYEKARYGRGLCGSDDVKRARKLAEGFHR